MAEFPCCLGESCLANDLESKESAHPALFFVTLGNRTRRGQQVSGFQSRNKPRQVPADNWRRAEAFLCPNLRALGFHAKLRIANRVRIQEQKATRKSVQAYALSNF